MLIHQLLPLATIITPNLLEAEVLCGFKITSKADMINAAKTISGQLNGGVSVKGGHSVSDADDLLYANEQEY